MSLLLQALQKAAKNRESSCTGAGRRGGSEPAAAARADRAARRRPPSSLEAARRGESRASRSSRIEEEDLFEPEELAAAPLLEPLAERFEPFATPSASSAQAATILRASETPTTGLGRLGARSPRAHLRRGWPACSWCFTAPTSISSFSIQQSLRGDLLSKPLAAQTPPPPDSADHAAAAHRRRTRHHTEPAAAAAPPAPATSGYAHASAYVARPPPRPRTPAASKPAPACTGDRNAEGPEAGAAPRCSGQPARTGHACAGNLRSPPSFCRCSPTA